LDLVAAHQEDAAVPPPLALSLYLRRRRPFEMKLAIAEMLAGLDIPRPRHLHIAVLDLPARLALASFPLRKVRAVEEHRRIRRRAARLLWRAGRTRRHDGRLRAARVVDAPLRIGQHR